MVPTRLRLIVDSHIKHSTWVFNDSVCEDEFECFVSLCRMLFEHMRGGEGFDASSPEAAQRTAIHQCGPQLSNMVQRGLARHRH